MSPSTSTSKIGLKSYYPPCMNRPLKFIRNFLLVWSNNSNMLQARDEDRTRQFTYDRSLLATHVDQWWWKTHFSAVNWGDVTFLLGLPCADMSVCAPNVSVGEILMSSTLWATLDYICNFLNIVLFSGIFVP
jgi:hypothetical protein